MEPEMIVAEISRNWSKAGRIRGDGESDRLLISQEFEAVIEHNRTRGYRLHSWKLDRVWLGDHLNESIVAVFEMDGRKT